MRARSIAACAAPAPFLADGARLDLAPYVAADQEPGDIEVIWGGMIVALRVGEEVSEIEVLAHPLDRPDFHHPASFAKHLIPDEVLP